MPIPVRVIARIDVKAPNVIKGVHLEGLRVIGQPGVMSRKYYADGADELVFMDVVASLYGRNNILSFVEEAARDVFVPMTVGGGIRSLDDIKAILRSGADKVAINTAAIARPELLKEASEAFGSQCIVLSVEAMNRGPSEWEAMTDNGRERTGKSVLDWISQAEELGIGEVLLTSVNAEGTRNGFDTALIDAVRKRVKVPVIASGGAGNAQHVVDLVQATQVDAVACASIFHYDAVPIPALKSALENAGIEVRR